MKNASFPVVLACAIALGALSCGEEPKQDPVAELEKTAAVLEKNEAPAEAATAAAPVRPAGPPPAKQVQEALVDFKAGKMEDAVTRLQMLRAMPNLNPQQRMALQDSIAAVMQEVYAMAAKGDKRAAAAIVRYEQMQYRR